MEIIEVSLICSKCGNTFEIKKECHNRLDAEMAETQLQRRRKPICPACFKKMKQTQANEDAKRLGLPEIIGCTDSQIAFAFSLRASFCERNIGQIQRASAELNKINPEKLSITAQKYDTDADTLLLDTFTKLGLRKAYICLTEINASKLISILLEK